MKVTFESASLSEAEVIIKGDITDPQVTALIEFVKAQNLGSSKKLILFKEDEQFLVEPEEIVFVEVVGSKVEVATENNRFDSKKKLYELKEMLQNESFDQIN